jgi:predicted nicotinamide N-methyase
MVPEVRLYTAHSGSGLRRLSGEGRLVPPPYWAYRWAGGTVLARYFLDHPDTVSSRRVLDLGAGSGIVGIAAAKAGASVVIAADTDPFAAAATRLNADLNGVSITAMTDDLTVGPPPAVDVVAVGDLFYERDLAERVTAFLDRCLAAGMKVLVGDPGRAFLPRSRLRLVAEYAVADFGDVTDAPVKQSTVFSFEPDEKTVSVSCP